MSSAIYNKEEFFETLQKMHAKFIDAEKIQYVEVDKIEDADCTYTFTTTSKSVDFGTSICVVLEKNNSELFTFNMTKYDEEAFIKTVKQPSRWEASMAQSWEQSEFNTFLVNKSLYNCYQISVVHNGCVLKDEDLDGVNDEYAIDDLLFSVDFYELIHSTYYSGEVVEQNNVPKKLKP